MCIIMYKRLAAFDMTNKISQNYKANASIINA